MLADASLNAIAVEQRGDRAARTDAQCRVIRRAAFAAGRRRGTCGTRGLAPPDAVFIGGGATVPGVIESVRSALRPAGRLVVNAVTLESQSLLLKCKEQWGGTLDSHRDLAGRSVGRGHRAPVGLASLHARDPMDLGKAMIVAGIGCRKGVSAAQVQAAIEAALAGDHFAAGGRTCWPRLPPKKRNAGIQDAAAAMGLA